MHFVNDSDFIFSLSTFSFHNHFSLLVFTIGQQTVKLLSYTGKTQVFPTWSPRFVKMMQRKGFYIAPLGAEEQLKEAPQHANVVSNEKKNHKVLRDAYKTKFGDIKEKRNNVWCHLTLTLDAGALALMSHESVGDDGIGNGAKA